jgi:hypothetical protein
MQVTDVLWLDSASANCLLLKRQRKELAISVAPLSGACGFGPARAAAACPSSVSPDHGESFAGLVTAHQFPHGPPSRMGLSLHPIRHAG